MDWQQDLPKPSDRRLALHVKPAAERALKQGHPWLFEGSIRDQSRDGRPGDLAVIFDRRERFLAIGLYDPDSPIRVRILQHLTPARIDGEWIRGRLEASADRRRALNEDKATTAFRLVHGENDGLPGLVVDRYDSNLVLKLDTAAWLPYLGTVAQALADQLGPERIVLRLSRSIQEVCLAFGLEEGQVIAGQSLEGPVAFLENGLRFSADLAHGQKTGFFLDQRENRDLSEQLVAADPGLRHVLNVFAYSGGFSLYAARAGAAHVTSLDLSQPALDAAETNFALNQDHPKVAAAHHELCVGDAFEFLDEMVERRQEYDVVIVDPPALARRQAHLAAALQAYRRLARDAVLLVRPGGLLVMSSCSARVTAEVFAQLVRDSVESAGRSLEEVIQTGHPSDHPITFREGAYLKCLFARVV